MPRGGIAMALLVRVVLFSSAVTLVLTVVQLALSYSSERARLESRLGEIDQATSRSLGESLWAMDSKQLGEQLDGILRLPSMRAAAVREGSSAGREFSVVRGEPQSSRVVAKEFPLVCCGDRPQQIGVLHIEATLTDIYRGLAAQAFVILLSNAAKTFLVAFFILFVVHHLATRHLLDIAASAARVTGADASPLRLRRPRIQGDELDQLVDALNAMRERMRQHAADMGTANARMAALLDNMPDLAWVKDIEGRFIAVNRAVAQSTGFAQPVDLIGKTDFDVHPEELARAYVLDDINVMASRGPRRIEEQHTRADGSLAWVETIKTAWHDGEGRIAGTVGTARDITARRQAETDRDARRVAELENRAKSDFLANMSHEIRTPMNAILGMSYLAMESGLDPQQLDYVRKIHEAAESLLGIINDILDFSKIEAGKLDLEAIPFRPADVMDRLVNLVGLSAEGKGIELLVELPPDLPDLLVGDPSRLGQVLLNLGNNAIKFTAHGEVTLAIEVLARDVRSVRLRFEVRDSGVGMTSEVRARLFRPFSQGDASTNRRYGGTGLGLSISGHLVKLMGGEIHVESTPGVGSRFHFELGFNVPPEAAAPSPPPRTLAGERALVVDDNACAREALARMGAALGLEVDTAEDGRDALRRVALAEDGGHPYELVLLDRQMPGLDGVDCVRLLAQRARRGRVLPVVLMAAAAARDKLTQDLAEQNLRVDALLTKPVLPQALSDACHQALGRATVPRIGGAPRDSPSLANQALLRGAQLLLVEDNAINREIAMTMLSRAGIVVSLAGDGQEALEMLGRQRFDGVLMDCQMPVMDGYEATRALRQHPQWRDLPVIAMTADAMVGDREKALAAGMNDHVAKPIHVDEMFATLARWIRPADAGQAGAGFTSGVEGSA
jgi:PAS domain S-box-containing protein